MRVARIKRTRQKHSLSPARVALNKFAAGTAKTLTLAGKIGFLVFLAAIIVLTLKGVAGFNFEIIWKNLPNLLWWRFPAMGEGEVLWGLGGLSMTILTAVIAITVSFPIGLLVGMGRISDNVLFRIPCTMYIEVIRGNPLIMVIFWIYFFIPILTGSPWPQCGRAPWR